ncbi:zinc finger MYM-type protein 1-like [Styela clava]
MACRRIAAKQPLAVYVHCAAHNLNLVINDAVNNVREIYDFFSIVDRIYVFFGQSIKRWDILSSFGSKKDKTLKRLNPTRWSSRFSSLTALHYRYADIMKALNLIILRSKKTEELSEAVSLGNKLQNFDFIIMIVLMETVLQPIDLLSKILQSQNQDLGMAAALLGDTLGNFQKIRNNYQEIRKKSDKVAETWGVEPKFSIKRQKNMPAIYDDINLERTTLNSESRFKVNVFYRCLNIVIFQLRHRFEGHRKIHERFHILYPEQLFKSDEQEIYSAGQRLLEQYSEDLSSALPEQLLKLKLFMRQAFPALKTPKELAHALMVEHRISTSYPDICTALLILLTLPVTTSTAERSFSKLKLIKNYLRSTMSQERLFGLALLSIESERLTRLDMTKMVDEFANAKARQRKF